MSDGLVQNLRSYPHASRSLRDEAADRIEALEKHTRAQADDIITLGLMVGRLEAALREIANKLEWEGIEPGKGRTMAAQCAGIARRALEGKT